MVKSRFVFLLFFFFCFVRGALSQVTGVVVDSRTHEPLDYVNVYYEGRNIGTMTDEKGHFMLVEDSLSKELTVSTMGYETQIIRLPQSKKSLLIKLRPEPKKIDDVTITAKKTKYSRKNNPAVELMKKVIAAKRKSDLRENPFFHFTKYEKMTFSVNEFTEKVFDEGEFKKFSFLKDHVERCPETGKLILPLTVTETVSETVYRKDPHSEKVIIKGESNRGVNELVNTGEILTTTLKDVFTTVDIYDEECRLLQYPFKSPIANSAINFYRYYIQDTIAIEGDSVIQLAFLPNNQQDFGFSGQLYIMADSSYQVRRVELSIPARSDVNFVESMLISQDFIQLQNGQRAAVNEDMLVQLKLTNWLSKFQVQKTTIYSDFSFDEIPKKVFKIKGPIKREPNSQMQDEQFWNSYRKVELTQSEGEVSDFVDKLSSVNGFKYVVFAFKALVENFVETSDSTHLNKVDIGPVNTIYTYNHYDKSRFRISALTNANLNPHFFASGYLAYGTKTQNLYGKLALTYSFNKKSYLPREFPQNNLTVHYMDDIISPFDKFIPTDKDNMFTALKAGKVDQFTRTREFHVGYDREWENGFKISASFTRADASPVDALFYQRLGTGTADGYPINDPSLWVKNIITSEFKVGCTFEPGATYINTKQRRQKINMDAPVVSVSHTYGMKGLFGSDYEYNFTEAGIYKRFWLGSWGKIDVNLKGGIQWNIVPFPLLIHPAANQSYIIEDNTFNLIGNLEFLNDRYASMMLSWDMNGKLFNRIPLIRKLKWREYFGVNVLWGTLTDKNNPASSGYTDSKLFYFPGHFDADGVYKTNTCVMDPKIPYIEAIVGIHNIFKLLHVQYVRRITYTDNPNINKWGIRFMVRVTF